MVNILKLFLGLKSPSLDFPISLKMFYEGLFMVSLLFLASSQLVILLELEYLLVIFNPVKTFYNIDQVVRLHIRMLPNSAYVGAIFVG